LNDLRHGWNCGSGWYRDFVPRDDRAAALGPRTSDVNLLSDFDGVIDLDGEVAHCAFHTLMSKQKLNCSKFPVRRFISTAFVRNECVPN
jgi:hypothetical protein